MSILLTGPLEKNGGLDEGDYRNLKSTTAAYLTKLMKVEVGKRNYFCAGVRKTGWMTEAESYKLGISMPAKESCKEHSGGTMWVEQVNKNPFC